MTAGWPLTGLGLRVLDLETEIAYYTNLGLTLLERDLEGASLGFEEVELLRLRRLPGGRRRPRGTAGLFHFALLLPGEEALGGFLKRIAERGLPLDGASDHLVSQALYLTDPEGNGIEVYADRPREQWTFDGDRVRMDTLPLDLDRLVRIAEPLARFPGSSRLGHMHLNVGDLDRSAAFYSSLGLGVIADWGIFRFLAWDRYHHHLAANLAQGRDAAPVAPDVAGLDYFALARADLPAGTLADPDGIEIRVGTAS